VRALIFIEIVCLLYRAELNLAANREGAARSAKPAAFAGFPAHLIAKAVPAELLALVVGVRYCKIAS
jgi:hypothetical protein